MNPKHETAPQKEDTATQDARKETERVAEAAVISQSAGQADITKKEVPAARKPAVIYSFFEILPKDAAYPDEKIKIDPDVPAG